MEEKLESEYHKDDLYYTALKKLVGNIIKFVYCVTP